ncbi:S8 family peptidase [Hydrogenimonas urashimensis]|uniref:S8 family peptidase n=1 Tax=Hydrogenimonas urashimensis TaxID=2740515 RepID=UPI0019166A3E|nr:S8 family serine peptidase [Hydrogenimonas urashimensis]
MKRIALLAPVFSLLLLLDGCGGGGSSYSSDPSNDHPIVMPPPPTLSYDENPLYPQQWYFHYDASFYQKLNASYGINPDPDAHIHPLPTQKYTGKGVKVAIIDDALDVDHEDLFGAVKKTYNVETHSSDVRPFYDTQNHGTEVTGVIGARSNTLGLSGIAPDAEIYFIKLPFGANISASQIYEAFEKAKEWGVDVVNCSWGSGDVPQLVEEAIVDLAKNGRNGKGTVIVFAAGNEDEPIGNDEASIPEVLAVGATNINNLRTTYSNYGPELDLMAPGGEHIGITTLDQMDDAGMATLRANYLLYNDENAFGGTSAAAPIVTAVVALMLEANPDLTREEIMAILEESADKIGEKSYGNDGRNDYYGYGKINVEHAFDILP